MLQKRVVALMYVWWTIWWTSMFGSYQYILAARNKLFGYDPLEEVMKGADNSMRFKNKAQEELSDAGLGMTPDWWIKKIMKKFDDIE